MNNRNKRLQDELAQAEKIWGRLADSAIAGFASLVSTYNLSVVSGDLLYLNNHWYVTHAGLIKARIS